MVAIWLPVLALFVLFAIDFAHLFDYSRNLQNRADAAALAAGVEYGGTCATTTPSAAAMDGDREGRPEVQRAPADERPVLPVRRPTTKNVPNLKAGTLDHYHVLINSKNYWQTGSDEREPELHDGEPDGLHVPRRGREAGAVHRHQGHAGPPAAVPAAPGSSRRRSPRTPASRSSREYSRTTSVRSRSATTQPSPCVSVIST